MAAMVFSGQREENPAPPKPPDDGGGNIPEQRISFRDKVLGNKKAPSPSAKRDLIKEKLFRVEYQSGNRLMPRCFTDDSIIHELSKPWEDALIVKLLGKNVGYKVMCDRLSTLWKPLGG
ncbi:hypothetical protein SESBI_04586 [Sesbania bispinosa]|nr:hypothetical protein SESBI_04586 [Sesbania bispinosa]